MLGRSFDLILVTLLVVAAAVVYALKYDAGRDAARAEELLRQIRATRDEIAELTAEWTYLSRPDRIQALVERYQDYLHLLPLTAERIGTVAEVPPRALEAPEGTTASDDPAGSRQARAQ